MDETPLKKEAQTSDTSDGSDGSDTPPDKDARGKAQQDARQDARQATQEGMPKDAQKDAQKEAQKEAPESAPENPQQNPQGAQQKQQAQQTRTSAPPPAADPVQTQADLGVLWVHGIGEQEQGETVTQFGTPVVKWISDWLAEDTGKPWRGVVQTEQACIRPTPVRPEVPAYTAVRIRLAQDAGTEYEQRWLFAEGWWSPQVIEPRMRPFLGWLVTRGPWVLLFHLHQHWLSRRAAEARRRRLAVPRRPALSRWVQKLGFDQAGHLLGTLFAAAAVLVLWLLGSFLLVTVWIFVSILGLLPIGRLRTAVLAFMKRIARVVGDSYVLVHDSTQRAALATAVLGALHWLRPKCKRLIVVAHSQGAAVAHDALSSTSAPRVDSLLTVGAGLTKLQALLHAEAKFPHRFVFAGLVAPFTAMALVLGARVPSLDTPAPSLWLGVVMFVITAVFIVYFVWESVIDTLRALAARAPELALAQTQPQLRWRDTYATHDPVPNGSLAHAIPVHRMRSSAVVVRQSALADHTEYWLSRAHFLPRLIRELARCAQLPLFEFGWPELSRARHAFCEKLQFLRRVHLADYLALLLPLVAALFLTEPNYLAELKLPAELKFLTGAESLFDVRSRAVAEAGNLSETLRGLGVETIVKIFDGLYNGLDWVFEETLGFNHGDANEYADLSVAFLVLGLALAIWRRIFLAIWRWWANLALESVFTPDQRSVRTWAAWVLDQVILGVLGAFPLLLAVVWTFAPFALQEFVAYAILAVFGGAMVVGLLVMAVWNAVMGEISRLRVLSRLRHDSLDEILAAYLSVGSQLAVIGVPVAVLWALVTGRPVGATFINALLMCFTVIALLQAIKGYILAVRAAWQQGSWAKRLLVALPAVVAVGVWIAMAWINVRLLGSLLAGLLCAWMTYLLMQAAGAMPSDAPRP